MASNKGRLLFLMQYMMDHIDDEHSISTDELIALCEANGYSANRHTIRDDMQSLYYDLAGMVFPNQYAGLINMGVPDDHLLYGSDGTFTPLPACIQLASLIDRVLGEKADNIYIDNPKKLMGF